MCPNTLGFQLADSRGVQRSAASPVDHTHHYVSCPIITSLCYDIEKHSVQFFSALAPGDSTVRFLFC